jgi:hemolysin activation/secretion protein
MDIGDATGPNDPNSSRAGGGGEFDVLMIDAGHVHPLPASLEVALSGRLQLASRKLLASEECGYGGGAIGRAFDNHEISGDYCLMGAAELRREPGVIFGDLAAAPYGFFDFGEVRIRGDAPPGQEDEDTGQSIGAGVRMNLGDALSAYLEYARPMTHDVALEGDRNGRVFFGMTARR